MSLGKKETLKETKHFDHENGDLFINVRPGMHCKNNPICSILMAAIARAFRSFAGLGNEK